MFGNRHICTFFSFCDIVFHRRIPRHFIPLHCRVYLKKRRFINFEIAFFDWPNLYSKENNRMQSSQGKGRKKFSARLRKFNFLLLNY